MIQRYKAITFTDGKIIHCFYNVTIEEAYLLMSSGMKYVLNGGFKLVKLYDGKNIINDLKMTISLYYY